MHDIIFSPNDYLVHTNHYISPFLRNFDLLLWDFSFNSNISRRGSTIVRYITAIRFFEKNSGSITLDILKALLADQTNYPFSISCSGLQSESKLLRGETNASIIMDLQEGIMHYCDGIPTLNSHYQAIEIVE